MIIGKSTAEKRKERRNSVNEMLRNGFKRFAWRPTKLYDGKYVFLEFYQAYLDSSQKHDIIKSSMPLWTVKFNYYTENYTIADAVIKRLKGNEEYEDE